LFGYAAEGPVPRSSMTCVLKTARAIVRFPDAGRTGSLLEKKLKKI
jgi:hypothetical protein